MRNKRVVTHFALVINQCRLFEIDKIYRYFLLRNIGTYRSLYKIVMEYESISSRYFADIDTISLVSYRLVSYQRFK